MNRAENEFERAHEDAVRLLHLMLGDSASPPESSDDDGGGVSSVGTGPVGTSVDGCSEDRRGKVRVADARELRYVADGLRARFGAAVSRMLGGGRDMLSVDGGNLSGLRSGPGEGGRGGPRRVHSIAVQRVAGLDELAVSEPSAV